MELGLLLAIVSLFVLEKGQCCVDSRSKLSKCITILLLIGPVQIVSLMTFPNRNELIHR